MENRSIIIIIIIIVITIMITNFADNHKSIQIFIQEVHVFSVTWHPFEKKWQMGKVFKGVHKNKYIFNLSFIMVVIVIFITKLLK